MAYSKFLLFEAARDDDRTPKRTVGANDWVAPNIEKKDITRYISKFHIVVIERERVKATGTGTRYQGK